MKNYTHRLLAAIAIITLSLGQVQNISAAAEPEKKSYPAQAWYLAKRVIGTTWYLAKKGVGTSLGLWLSYGGTRMGITALTLSSPETALRNAVEARRNIGLSSLSKKEQAEYLQMFQESSSLKFPLGLLTVGALITYLTWGTELRNYWNQKNEPKKA